MALAINLPLFEYSTLAAERDNFIRTFGLTPENIIERIERLAVELATQPVPCVPIFWRMRVFGSSAHGMTFDWIAVKSQVDPKDLGFAAIPLSIEPHLLVQTLLPHAGTSVAISPLDIPYIGGLVVGGEFLKEPLFYLSRRQNAIVHDSIDEFYQSGEYADSQVMSGFAMNVLSGQWATRVWLITPDGAIIDIGEEHTSYFGIRLLPEAAESLLGGVGDKPQ